MYKYEGLDMGLLTLEGIVENGQIRLCEDVVLPERATVYVVVPDIAVTPRPPNPSPARILSPRLAHPEQATDFAKQVIEVPADA
jgi:hypothetical protein